MRIADAAAETLANYGARLAFGMPGGEVLTLIDALNAAGVRFILARHETQAAIMAAGAATILGAPGVLVTTVGPGLANAVNGIADASQEHVPLIVLAGVVDHAIRGRYTHQVFDQKALLRPLVKGCFEIEPQGAAAVMARAIELALAPPMGPVFIEIAPGTAPLLAQANDIPRLPPERVASGCDAGLPAIQALRDKVAAAVRPVIVAGWEVARTPGASARLRTFAEQLGAPVVTTYKGKGVLDEAHALSLGGAGLSPLADKHLLPLVAAADVAILAGYDPIEMRPGWLDPFGAACEVIEISAAPPDHGMHRASSRVIADVGAVLAALTPDQLRSAAPWPGGEIAAVKAALREAFQVPSALGPNWGPHAAIASLQKLLPPDATITVDSGAHRILLSQMLHITEPMGLMQSAGFCTMAAAIPLAAGVKAATPGRTVIAVLGDGGLEMGLGELATLRDEGLGIIIVVFQDESLALIELKQRQAKLADAGVRLGRTPFETIAEAFDGHGARVASVSAFEEAFSAALTRDRFSLIVCEIKAEDYADRI